MSEYIMMSEVTKKEKPEMRKQLKGFCTIDHLLEAFSISKRIVFITGAGVSVSCGIPDFRSATGIYNTMECQEIGIPSPELLFDLEFFLMDPNPFFKYAHNLMPTNRTPSVAHNFLSLLESKKKLLRNYTQNIDGLERISGQKKVIECHGTMDFFNCLECRKKTPRSEVYETVLSGEVPHCVHCAGVMKPMITFFGERSPPAVSKFAEEDMQKCDLIVVMGTSLKVGGAVVELLGHARKEVPQVLINLSPITPPSVLASEGFDISLIGSCDDVVTYISDMIQIRQDQADLKMKKVLLAKIKKKRVCKYCKGTRLMRVTPTASPPPPTSSSLSSSLSSSSFSSSSSLQGQPPEEEKQEAPPSKPAVVEGRRVRKPSQKMIDISSSATSGVRKSKTKKIEETGAREEDAIDTDPDTDSGMKECTHCKQNVSEADALEASLLPSSELRCTPMIDDARQFSICTASKILEVKEASDREDQRKELKQQQKTKSKSASKSMSKTKAKTVLKKEGKKRVRAPAAATAVTGAIEGEEVVPPPAKKKRGGRPKK